MFVSTGVKLWKNLEGKMKTCHSLDIFLRAFKNRVTNIYKAEVKKIPKGCVSFLPFLSVSIFSVLFRATSEGKLLIALSYMPIFEID